MILQYEQRYGPIQPKMSIFDHKMAISRPIRSTVIILLGILIFVIQLRHKFFGQIFLGNIYYFFIKKFREQCPSFEIPVYVMCHNLILTALRSPKLPAKSSDLWIFKFGHQNLYQLQNQQFCPHPQPVVNCSPETQSHKELMLQT